MVRIKEHRETATRVFTEASFLEYTALCVHVHRRHIFLRSCLMLPRGRRRSLAEGYEAHRSVAFRDRLKVVIKHNKRTTGGAGGDFFSGTARAEVARQSPSGRTKYLICTSKYVIIRDTIDSKTEQQSKG